MALGASGEAHSDGGGDCRGDGGVDRFHGILLGRVKLPRGDGSPPDYLREAARGKGVLPQPGQAPVSRARSARLTSVPHAKPPIVPSPRSTRWQGTKSATALRAQMDAAARTAAGDPSAAAKPV